MKIKDTFRKRFILMLVVLFTCLQKNVAQQNIHPINYQINLNTVNVFNNGIWGNTVIKTVSDSIGNKLTINLLGFTIDSILVNNILSTYTRTETNISINHTFATGDTSVIEVHYHGIPQTDEQWGGFYVNGTYAFNMGVGFASNPHNFGKAWFPCFDNFTNRATYNFNITTLMHQNQYISNHYYLLPMNR
jgi:aminopeptidase N